MQTLDEPKFNNLNELAGFLRIIGNQQRLRILFRLLNGPCCVCDLTKYLNRRQPCISQHLMVLRQAGLISSERQGWKRLNFISSEKLKHCLIYMQTSWLTSGEILIKSGLDEND